MTISSIANGFANRFLFVCARRSKLLPESGALDELLTSDEFGKVMESLRKAAEFARIARPLQRDDEAKAMWRAAYGELSEGKPGMLGAITSRLDVLAVRLSLVCALLDRSLLIKAVHLNAALAVIKYCEASARFIFGDSL